MNNNKFSDTFSQIEVGVHGFTKASSKEVLHNYVRCELLVCGHHSQVIGQQTNP